MQFERSIESLPGLTTEIQVQGKFLQKQSAITYFEKDFKKQKK